MLIQELISPFVECWDWVNFKFTLSSKRFVCQTGLIGSRCYVLPNGKWSPERDQLIIGVDWQVLGDALNFFGSIWTFLEDFGHLALLGLSFHNTASVSWTWVILKEWQWPLSGEHLCGTCASLSDADPLPLNCGYWLVIWILHLL